MAEQRNNHPDQMWFEKLGGYARELIQHSLKLLNEPVPDTFVGRKTYEPFPHEESGYGTNDGKSGLSHDRAGTETLL
ncbi:hypothetical protein [Bradyrhizobium brasilense]|uniref:hypothetical protein n=1 Tax=Bradyrhizobium brasilense TaxID=1419277 RepID=UPI001E499AC9|nr:hypothetical protein [Bradyrhizobium brasilense]MCC8976342.1 hypothetical protein [Bradyrhizobium brasilense]